MRKHKVIKGFKESCNLFKFYILPHLSLGLHLSKGESPHYRFMIYITKKIPNDEALLWWTFIDLF